MDPVDREIVNYLKKPKEVQDEHHHFGMSEQLRGMDPAMASYIKLQIQQTIHYSLYPVLPANQ